MTVASRGTVGGGRLLEVSVFQVRAEAVTATPQMLVPVAVEVLADEQLLGAT